MSSISSLSTRTWSVSGTCLALWTRSSSLSISTRTSMALPVSSARDRFLQASRHSLGHELRDVASEDGDLLHSAGGEKTVLRRRHQVDGFDVRGQLAVELVHLELVLEVRDRAQSFDDRHGALLARIVDDQLVERLGADVAEVAGRLLDERAPVLGAEQRLVLADRGVDDGDDELVEKRRGAGDDVDVAVGDRAIRARADGDAVIGSHGCG